MSLLVPFCDRCTKLATVVIPRESGEERYCEYHWRARMGLPTEETAGAKAESQQS